MEIIKRSPTKRGMQVEVTIKIIGSENMYPHTNSTKKQNYWNLVQKQTEELAQMLANLIASSLLSIPLTAMFLGILKGKLYDSSQQQLEYLREFEKADNPLNVLRKYEKEFQNPQDDSIPKVYKDFFDDSEAYNEE